MASRASEPRSNAEIRRQDELYEGGSALHRAYWNIGIRRMCYPLPSHVDDELWRLLRVERSSADGGRERVLQSHNTRGSFEYRIDPSGVARVCEWIHCPELRMLNVPGYFQHHPHINAIWCDTRDTGEYTESSANSDPSAVRTASVAASTHSAAAAARGGGGEERGDDDEQGETALNYALVIRRRELTPGVCQIFHDEQAAYFTDNGLPMPPIGAFTVTLHGR